MEYVLLFRLLDLKMKRGKTNIEIGINEMEKFLLMYKIKEK